MPSAINLDHIAIVLQKPRFPENIGSVARAMCNMGLSRLVVSAPENWDRFKIDVLATAGAAAVVDNIEKVDDLKSAIDPFNYVVGTTARLGRQRPVIAGPEKLARKLIPISQDNQVAIVFGPEDRGLTNAEIRLCQRLVNIPTADFSSLNLAQAVMIVCYALFRVAGDEKPEFYPRLAVRHELDGMYEQLKEILIRIDYIKPDNPDYWMSKIRRFGTRMRLRAREVNIVRGICRQIDWYSRKCYEDGKAAAKAPGKPTGRPPA